MKTILSIYLAVIGCACVAVSANAAAVRYVNLNNTSPNPPYTNWATAATVIQDAVDVALPGDEVVVTNGVYQTGTGTAFPDGPNSAAQANRIAVTKPLVLRSVNGPDVTVIHGQGLLRCVYLTNGATLAGFTLTNGSATRGGGVFCATGGVVSNCVLSGNTAGRLGGGAVGGTLNNCILGGNSAGSGGGGWGATMNNCVVTGNFATEFGGGSYGGILNDCTLSGNSTAYTGGGAFLSTLNNCILSGNSAAYTGGGAASATLNNCVVTGNSAWEGGGAARGEMNNCTVTGNSATQGGGVFRGVLNNCIVYYNNASYAANYSDYRGNYSDTALNYCCTTPLPTNGVGNIIAEPQLASDSHISANSPCRGAGNFAHVRGVDIDGEAWANPPSIGCDELHVGSNAGLLSVAIQASYTNVAAGFEVNFTGQIVGNLSVSHWEFGDGTVVSNRPYAAHTWLAPGIYPVVLRAYNQSNPEGVTATVTMNVIGQPVHYVALASSNPVAPYSSWATAATNIQDAVDVGVAGGLVLVSNGVYQTGGRVVHAWGALRPLTNRVAITKPLTLRSVNGPLVTIIRGGRPTNLFNSLQIGPRCVYLTNGAQLVGFTLTNGSTSGFGTAGEQNTDGGGAWCESQDAVLSNCIVTGNVAASGGGVWSGTLHNCKLINNSAGGTGSRFGVGGGAAYAVLNNCLVRGNGSHYGGGALASTLNNCTVIENSASIWFGVGNGSGALGGTLNNCIVYFNSDPWTSEPSNYSGCVINYTCTMPLPTTGIGNITNAPLFVDAAVGDFRLQSNSPCINAGRNADVSAGFDLDGNPRIVGGTVDIGAYEFQLPQSAISYAWLQQYGLPTDGSVDLADPDGDGFNNWQEWRIWTDPTNSLSALRLLSPIAGTNDIQVRWQSVVGQSYFLERGSNLGTTLVFAPLADTVVGQTGTTIITDTNAVGAGPLFYRVGVRE